MFIISGCLAIPVGILSFGTRNLMQLDKIKNV